MLKILLAVCLVSLNLTTTAAADNQIDFSAVKKFAMFSEAAYASSHIMKDIAKTYGYELKQYDVIRDAQVSFYLLEQKQTHTQLIVVRGTANVENVVVDASIKLVQDSLAGVVLHEGFAYAAKAVLKEITPALNKTNHIDITGHSLGGAVAVILGMYLDASGYTVGQLDTFGQPKVTNIPGSLKYAHLHILRFVTPSDLVPLVPPLDPMDLKNIDIYWHVGEEVILLPGQDFSRIGVMDSMLRATKIISNKIDEKNLEQHQMLTYLSAIESKLPNALQVPYQSDINVMDILKMF